MKNKTFPVTYAHTLLRTATVIATYADKVLSSEPNLNITFAQYRILASLYGGAVTQADIAKDLSISGPAMSRHMQILHQKGYITRVVNADEQRAHIVSLTKRGDGKRRLAERVLVKSLQPILATVSTSSRASVLRTLSKTIDHARA